MQDGDFPTARERALALRDWLEGGGFYPPNYNPAEVRAYLASVLRRTAGTAAAKGTAQTRRATDRKSADDSHGPVV